MTTLSKADLEKHYQGRAVTEGWDVLVSYAEGPLNLLLKDRWAKSLKARSFPVTLRYDFDDIQVHVLEHWTIQLSAPSLSFDTAAGTAKLLFDVDGSYYQEKIKTDGSLYAERDDGTFQATTVHHLQHGYKLEVSPPIASVTGDTEEHQLAHDVVTFKDNTEAAHYLVFHVKSENTTWLLKSPNLKTHPINDNMKKLGGAVVSWLQNTDNVKWLDIRMAEVTNKADPKADTDTLRPRSFIFTTRNGVLNVYIYTTGQTGERNPSYTERDPLPIASRYGASIIISQHLFGKYVLDQIKMRCKEKLSAKPSILGRDEHDIVKPHDSGQQSASSASGIEWSLYPAGAKTWNLSNLQGLNKYKIDAIKQDFDSHPLIFGVKDVREGDSFVPRSTWSWYMQAIADWTLADVTANGQGSMITYYSGRTQVTATLDKTGKPFAKLDGDKIILEVNYDTSDAPKIYRVAQEPVGAPYRTSMGIPPAIDNLKITLPSFKAELKGLDFFMAKNVIIPDTKTNPIRATDVLVPHDVFVLAEIPTSTSASYSSLSSTGEIFPQDSASGTGQSMEDLLDRLYTNDVILARFIQAAVRGDKHEISALVAKEAPGLDATSLRNFLNEHTTAGPKFDIRYAGGVYKPKESNSPFHELMVHPVHRTIYVDGHAVKSQVKHPDGQVTFETHDGKMSYKVTFSIKDVLNAKGGSFSLHGTSWPSTGSESSATSIEGFRIFPWDERTSGASIHIDRQGYKSLAFALELVNPVDEDERSAAEEQLRESAYADVLTVVGAITGVLNMLNGFLNLDKNTGETLRRLKKRYGRVKRAILGKDREGFAKELKGFADVSDAEKELAIEAARIVNQSLNKSKSTDPTAVLHEVKPDINKALADFLYSGIEIASRKGFSSGFLLDGEGLENAFKAAIEENLEKFVSRNHYDAYLDALVHRVMFERERDEAVRESRDISKQIAESMREIKRVQEERQAMERERATHERVLEEKGLSPEEAKKEVQAEIDKKVQEETNRTERLEQERKERDAAEKRRADLKEDIKERQGVEAEQRAQLWRQHGK